MDGFIYVVKASNYHKVGIAKDVKSRVRGLQIGNPIPIEIVSTYKVDDPIRYEKHIHKSLSRWNVGGEWFSLDDEGMRILIKELESISNSTLTQEDMEVIALCDIDSGSIISEPEIPLRIETWTRKQKNGNIHKYWQWTQRGSGHSGRNGGLKKRIYGGKLATP